MKRISTALLGGALLSAALLVACGGGRGSTGSSLPGGAPPVATDPPAGAPQSFSASDAVAIPTAAPGAATVAVPLSSDASGASANAALSTSGSIPTDATVAATFSTSGDATLPALAKSRSVQNRSVRDDSKKNVIAYLKLQFSADVTLPQAPAFSFVVPGTLPTAGVTYWLAFLDPLRTAASWQTGFEGPATVTVTSANGKGATQLAFASNGHPIAFSANQTYYFAVFATSATAASPTPVPSSVPTNAPRDAPPASVGVTPRNIQFASVTSSPSPITFVEQGYTGAFALHGDCSGIVNTSGASPTFTITPIGVGSCVLVGIGDRGASAIVHVGVVTPFETPHPTSSSSPSPQPSHSPEATSAPTSAPSHSPEPTHSPEATQPPTIASPTPAPSHSPEPTHAPTTASPSPAPSHSPEPTHAPANTSPSPEPTHAPGTSVSPSPTPTASARPQ